jgi:hypothetical protein
MGEQRTAFLTALELERASRGLSWRAVARAADVHPGSLYRMIHGGDVMASVVWALWAWMDSLEPQFTTQDHLNAMCGVHDGVWSADEAEPVDHDTLLMQPLSAFVEVE